MVQSQACKVMLLWYKWVEIFEILWYNWVEIFEILWYNWVEIFEILWYNWVRNLWNSMVQLSRNLWNSLRNKSVVIFWCFGTITIHLERITLIICCSTRIYHFCTIYYQLTINLEPVSRIRVDLISVTPWLST